MRGRQSCLILPQRYHASQIRCERGLWKSGGIRDFAVGKRVKAFSGVERSARLKLDRLESATSLKDVAALPGNRFEALIGDRKGQYSIRINDQWRICFEWPDRSPGPSNVEIVDYH